MAAYASLSLRDPAVRAFLKSQNLPLDSTRRLYLRDGGPRSITRTARDERIVEAYHSHRLAGLGKYAAFDKLLGALELRLGRRQVRRILAAHELECGHCRLSSSTREVQA